MTDNPSFAREPKPGLPVRATLKLAVQDAFQAYRSMPLLLVAAFVISLLNRLLLLPLFTQKAESGEQFSLLVLSFFGGSLTALFFTPILVALHRFAILRETTSIAFITMHEDAILEYFITSFAMNLSLKIPDLISLKNTNNDAIAMIMSLISFAIFCFIGFWTTRFSLVLPAIAVRAANVSLRGSARATKGVFWRMVLLMMLAFFPPLIAGVMIDSYLTKLGSEFLGASAMAFGMAFAIAIMTMVLSHIYMWRSTGPSGLRERQRRSTSAPPPEGKNAAQRAGRPRPGRAIHCVPPRV